MLITGGNWVWPGLKIGHRQLVEDVEDDEDGTLQMETLSIRPRVFRVFNLISPQEIDNIIALAEPKLRTSEMAGSRDGKRFAFKDEDRTSQSAWLPSNSSEVLQLLDRRMARLLRVDRSHQEKVQVIRYTAGAEYKIHVDTFAQVHTPPLPCQSIIA